MPTCLAHPDRDAVAACSACGADTCAACEVRFRDASWCEACFSARHAAPATDAQAVPPPPRAHGPRLRSPGLAALLSFFVPGLGTLYAFGYPARRALLQFAGWALGLWVVARAENLFAVVAFFAWTAYWIWQILDAHGTAVLVNGLGRVPSEDEAAAYGRGPLLRTADSRSLGTALLVVGCLLLVVELGGVLLAGARWILPFALIGLGIAIVWRARRARAGAAASEAAG